MKVILLSIVLILTIGCVNKEQHRGVQTVFTNTRSNGTIIKNNRKVQTKQFGEYYALLIYVDDYTNLPKLETPRYDIEKIEEILKSRYGFKETNIVSNPRNGDELIEVLDNYITKIKRDDNLLIYYAGHGSFEERMGAGFWQLKDARENSRVGWIPIESAINNTLNMINAKHILVISDSCYSGAILRKGGTRLVLNQDDIYYNEIHQKRSRTALTSGGLEPVLDASKTDPNHSVFVNALFNTLQNNKKHLFSLEEKFPEIKRYIKLNANQTPQYSDIARTGHEMGGDFIFVDNLASRRVTQTITTPPIPMETRIPMPQPPNYLKLGDKYRKAGDINSAKQSYSKACNAKNKFGCAWLGWIYDKEYKGKQAKEFLVKACSYGHQKSCELIRK